MQNLTLHKSKLGSRIERITYTLKHVSLESGNIAPEFEKQEDNA
jgi:hypothetical protein